MEGHLRMSAKERERLKVFERVKRDDLQQKEASGRHKQTQKLTLVDRNQRME
jgi:hypothetical protein